MPPNANCALWRSAAATGPSPGQTRAADGLPLSTRSSPAPSSMTSTGKPGLQTYWRGYQTTRHGGSAIYYHGTGAQNAEPPPEPSLQNQKGVGLDLPLLPSNIRLLRFFAPRHEFDIGDTRKVVKVLDRDPAVGMDHVHFARHKNDRLAILDSDLENCRPDILNDHS